MLIVNSIYIITQLINGVRRILVAVLPKDDLTECERLYSYVYGLAVAAISINASANFFIFVLFNNHFRRQVQKLWALVRRRINKVGIETTTETPTKNEPVTSSRG